MSHAHHPDRHHGHAHAELPETGKGRAFLLGIILNLGFVVVEAAYGLIANSMALLADAGHNLSDVLGLIAAWMALRLGQRKPSARFTYGLRGSTILAALFNAILLLVACGAIALAAVQRFRDPAPIAGGTMMAVAGIGIAINLATALLFVREQKEDLNVRGAFLHMAADAAVSAGVVVAGLLVVVTGRAWIDPAMSLAIVAVIVAGTWSLLRQSLAMAVGAVPSHIDPAAVEAALCAVPGVTRVHHIHIWPTSTTQTALTAHLVMPAGSSGDRFLAEVAHDLEHRFGIGHVTLQVERGDEAKCALHAHG